MFREGSDRAPSRRTPRSNEAAAQSCDQTVHLQLARGDDESYGEEGVGRARKAYCCSRCKLGVGGRMEKQADAWLCRNVNFHAASVGPSQAPASGDLNDL